MNLRNKIATGIGVISLSALTLLGGCKSKVPEPQIYLFPDYNMIIGHGDLDKDGDLDRFIILDGILRRKLYFFENDGEDNFKMKILYLE